jgi:hypothetical protein
MIEIKKLKGEIMKKLLFIIICIIALAGCGKNPLSVNTDNVKNTESLKWEGTSGTNFLYAKEIIYFDNGFFTSVERQYKLSDAKQFESNLQILFNENEYDNLIDYSKYCPQVWINKRAGTIRIIGNKNKYFYVSFIR